MIVGMIYGMLAQLVVGMIALRQRREVRKCREDMDRTGPTPVEYLAFKLNCSREHAEELLKQWDDVKPVREPILDDRFMGITSGVRNELLHSRVAGRLAVYAAG